MHWLNTLFSKLGQLFNWWFVVVPWERAVRVRLGKRMSVIGPGIHLQIPFIDRVYVQNVRQRVSATTSQALTTRDGVTITIQAAFRFKIIDILKLYDSLHQVNSTICQEIEGHFSEYIITHDASECTPELVLAYVTGMTDLEQYGLECVEVFLTDFVRVKTYRLIQGGLDRYTSASISTDYERRSKGGEYTDEGY